MIRVFVVLFLLVIWFSVLLFGSHALFLGLLTLVCAGVGLEMAAMLPSGCATEKRVLAVMGIACAMSFVYGIGTADLVAKLLAVVLMGAAPFLAGDAEAPFSRGIAFVGWGALIILAEVCLAALADMRLRADGAQLVTFVSACTFFRDLAANVAGQVPRKGRLIASHVSATKTWKGTVIGAGATILFALIIIRVPLFASIRLLKAILIAAACGVGGQFGDLFESLLKRRAGLRDSSRVFTVHQGGVLDAVDGFLCAVPLVQLVLTLTPV